MNCSQPARSISACTTPTNNVWSPDRWATAGLFVACVFLFGWRLGVRDLWNSHEARAGMNAQSILHDDWRLPHLNDGRPELQKPPLYYWLVAAVARVHGNVDAWAVRLPSAFAALLCVLLLATHAPRAGLLAGVVLATAIHFTWLARTGRIDMPLTAVIAVTLLFLQRAQTSPPCGYLLIVYLALTAALLLKGPIGVVLPVAVWGVWLLVEGQLPPPWQGRAWLRLLHRYGVWWGVPLLLVLVVPWCLWVQAETKGDWFRIFVWFHNVERGMGGSRLRGHPWWFYAPQLLLDLLPWSLVLVPALYWWWRRGGWRDDALGRFGLVWAVTMTVLLSLARYKRADYLVPAYPGYALFLGSVLARWVGERNLSPRWVVAGILAMALAGWGVYLSALQPRYEPTREMHTFAARIRTHTPSPLPIILFQTENHLLAFHLGRPIEILLHWEELRRRGDREMLVVMSLERYHEASRQLPEMMCVRLFDNRPHEKPLLVVRIQRNESGGERADSVQGMHSRATERTPGN